MCAGKVVVLSNCLATTHPHLALEWHSSKNGSLTPYDVTAGSGKKVWWKCPKADDHEWIAIIADRHEHGCGACAGKIVVLSNCLATISPHLALEWHPTKNGSLTPYHVTAKSNQRAWWKCPKADDHAWIAIIADRHAHGCGVCASQTVALSNCLATIHPHLIEEWHHSKNGSLTPYNVTPGSKQSIWWKCPKAHDHEWSTSPNSRTNKHSKCPMCAGKVVVLSNCLATTHPPLALEWHPSKNGSLTPYDVTAGSGKKVWWKCPKAHDHEWIAKIAERKRYGCPVCAGKMVVLSNCLATFYSHLVNEWHPTKNEDLTPYKVTSGSKKRVWWLCFNGHEWIISIDKRKNGRNCPECRKL